MITKLEIEELVREYETTDFIKDDPVQFPHRYNGSRQDSEIAGFIASLLAYGNRKVFIKKLNPSIKRFSSLLQIKHRLKKKRQNCC